MGELQSHTSCEHQNLDTKILCSHSPLQARPGQEQPRPAASLDSPADAAAIGSARLEGSSPCLPLPAPADTAGGQGRAMESVSTHLGAAGGAASSPVAATEGGGAASAVASGPAAVAAAAAKSAQNKSTVERDEGARRAAAAVQLSEGAGVCANSERAAEDMSIADGSSGRVASGRQDEGLERGPTAGLLDDSGLQVPRPAGGVEENGFGAAASKENVAGVVADGAMVDTGPCNLDGTFAGGEMRGRADVRMQEAGAKDRDSPASSAGLQLPSDAGEQSSETRKWRQDSAGGRDCPAVPAGGENALAASNREGLGGGDCNGGGGVSGRGSSCGARVDGHANPVKQEAGTETPPTGARKRCRSQSDSGTTLPVDANGASAEESVAEPVVKREKPDGGQEFMGCNAEGSAGAAAGFLLGTSTNVAMTSEAAAAAEIDDDKSGSACYPIIVD